MTEVNTVTYFCPEPCEGLDTEQPRDTGEKYYGPDSDDEEEELSTSSQHGVGVAQTQAIAKPEPGTVYTLPETCVPGRSKSLTRVRRTNPCGDSKLNTILKSPRNFGDFTPFGCFWPRWRKNTGW